MLLCGLLAAVWPAQPRKNTPGMEELFTGSGSGRRANRLCRLGRAGAQLTGRTLSNFRGAGATDPGVCGKESYYLRELFRCLVGNPFGI